MFCQDSIHFLRIYVVIDMNHAIPESDHVDIGVSMSLGEHAGLDERRDQSRRISRRLETTPSHKVGEWIDHRLHGYSQPMDRRIDVSEVCDKGVKGLLAEALQPVKIRLDELSLAHDSLEIRNHSRAPKTS
jgi:hypothetical protein